MDTYSAQNIILITGIAIICCSVPFLWKKFITYFITLVHEYGHALIDLVTLNGIHHIKVFANSSGETASYREEVKVPILSSLVTFVGYPTPILLGSFLIALPHQEWKAWGYGILFLYGVICLFFHRSIIGLLIGLLWVGFFGYLTFLGQDSNHLLFLTLGIFLIVGGIKDLLHLVGLWIMSKSEETDLRIIKDKIGVPQLLTLLMMVVSSIIGSYFLITM